jgi:exodeoxyribonuclease VII large subunit
MEARLAQIARRHVAERRLRLADGVRTLGRLSPRVLIAARQQRVDDLAGRARRSLRHHLAVAHERLRSASLRLGALDPRAVLARGYAVVRRADGQVVVSPAQVAAGERLDVQVRDGEFGVHVEG